MTAKESIEWVIDRMTYGRYTPSISNPLVIDECYEAGMMAIEALEKQTPKKPLYVGEFTRTLFRKEPCYTCPTCGNCLLKKQMNERQVTNYCWDCGQKIDWSEV